MLTRLLFVSSLLVAALSVSSVSASTPLFQCQSALAFRAVNGPPTAGFHFGVVAMEIDQAVESWAEGQTIPSDGEFGNLQQVLDQAKTLATCKKLSAKYAAADAAAAKAAQQAAQDAANNPPIDLTGGAIGGVNPPAKTTTPTTLFDCQYQLGENLLIHPGLFGPTSVEIFQAVQVLDQGRSISEQEFPGLTKLVKQASTFSKCMTLLKSHPSASINDAGEDDVDTPAPRRSASRSIRGRLARLEQQLENLLAKFEY